MVIFHSFLYVYQRVDAKHPHIFSQGKVGGGHPHLPFPPPLGVRPAPPQRPAAADGALGAAAAADGDECGGATAQLEAPGETGRNDGFINLKMGVSNGFHTWRIPKKVGFIMFCKFPALTLTLW